MKSIVLAFVATLLLAASASAQTITGTTVTITNTTTGITTTAALLNVPCGQPKVVSTNTVNARRIVWQDSTNAALDCIWTDPGTGILVALPFGPASYTATLMYTSAAGNSPQSLPSLPFTQPGLPPGAPISVRVVQIGRAHV